MSTPMTHSLLRVLMPPGPHHSLVHIQVKSLPRMVVQDEVGSQVTSALTSVTTALNLPKTGPPSHFAQAASQARATAEEAFFHPSVMSLLYNPLEHHVAVYAVRVANF